MTLAITRIAALAVFGMSNVPNAMAAPIDWDASAQLDLLLSGAAQDAAFEETPFVGRLSAGFSGEHVFANGVNLRVAFGAVAERDHPRHDPRGGRAGECPATSPLCPNALGRNVRGYFSGFTPNGPIADTAGRVALESAYVSLTGGYGEISIGRDEGAAARFSAVPANILLGGSLVQPKIDVTGFGGLAARNDLSGQSFKITALTPRILGVKLGAGWTPVLEAQGVDQGFRRGADAPTVARPRQIAEFGASLEHDWPSGLSAHFSGSFATGANGAGPGAFGRLSAWSFGGGLERAGWSFGVQRLGSDNGWRGGKRGYRATTASIVRQNGAWSVQASGGHGRDSLVQTPLSTFSLGASRKVQKSLRLLVGMTGVRRAVPVLESAGPVATREQSLAIFTGLSFTP